MRASVHHSATDIVVSVTLLVARAAHLAIYAVVGLMMPYGIGQVPHPPRGWSGRGREEHHEPSASASSGSADPVKTAKTLKDLRSLQDLDAHSTSACGSEVQQACSIDNDDIETHTLKFVIE